jgi:HEAT repeat protein
MRTFALLRTVALFVAVFCMGVAWAEDAPPLVNGGGATLQTLVGTDKLVTVVLNENGVLDQNLKVVDVGPNYLSVLSPTNQRTAYRFSSVKEIRVQAKKVETKTFNIEDSRSLKIEEQKVLNRALARVREIFDAANSDQLLKMRAATILALDEKKDAIEYLHKLAASNDLETQLDGTLSLYRMGAADINKKVIAAGLASGNRKIKSKAALLAGLTNDAGSTATLLAMARDRAADIAAPAARALGRMKAFEALPIMMKMIMELNQVKGEAAIFGLTRLGGPEVIAQVKEKLDTAEGQIRYRLATVLYNLDDPTGKKLMEQEMLPTATLKPDAALLLAANGNYDGMEWLRWKLKQRFDETPDKLVYRAKAAIALIQGGDAAADSHLQDLLRSSNDKVKRQVCRLVAELGKRRLIPIMQPSIESSEPSVSLMACTATVAMARPPFKDRLVESAE